MSASTADVRGRRVVGCFPEGSRKRALFAEKGRVLVGDVHPDVEEVAGAVTPVPGGVGPADHRDAAAEHGHRGRTSQQEASRTTDAANRADRRHRHGQELRVDAASARPACRWWTPTCWRARSSHRGPPAWRRSRKRFGPDAVRSDGTLDRVRLGHLIFRGSPGAARSRGDHPPRGAQGDRRVLLEAAQADAARRGRHPAAVRDRARRGSSTRWWWWRARARCSSRA